MKHQLDYVVSGCGRMQLFHRDMMATPEVFKIFKDRLMSIPAQVKVDLKEYSKKSDPVLSMLFNGFTEKSFTVKPKSFESYNWLNTDSVYADSGGLQIVTVGKTITPALKTQIYATQSVADYAMCFDVIPLTRTKEVFEVWNGVSRTQSSNERSNTGNKIFEDANFDESAMATALNVKEQVDYFRKHNAKTKVIIIVQGNTPQDMKNFYNTIASQLTEEDYEHIGGIAVADTCMGNGELESIKMLHAAHLIAQDCHPAVKNHLHFLGIGSLYRLRPVVYLARSGFLDGFKRLSYDSTSHTSCFDMGLLKLNGTCKSFGTYRTPLAEQMFEDMYTTFEKTFKPLVTRAEFKKVAFGEHGDSGLAFTALRKNAMSRGINSHIAGMLIKTAHTFYQIRNFMMRAEDIWSEENDQTPIGNLLTIKNETDILRWYNTNRPPLISSHSITRRSDISTLDALG